MLGGLIYFVTGWCQQNWFFITRWLWVLQTYQTSGSFYTSGYYFWGGLRIEKVLNGYYNGYIIFSSILLPPVILKAWYLIFEVRRAGFSILGLITRVRAWHWYDIINWVSPIWEQPSFPNLAVCKVDSLVALAIGVSHLIKSFTNQSWRFVFLVYPCELQGDLVVCYSLSIAIRVSKKEIVTIAKNLSQLRDSSLGGECESCPYCRLCHS